MEMDNLISIKGIYSLDSFHVWKKKKDKDNKSNVLFSGDDSQKEKTK